MRLQALLPPLPQSPNSSVGAMTHSLPSPTITESSTTGAQSKSSVRTRGSVALNEVSQAVEAFHPFYRRRSGGSTLYPKRVLFEEAYEAHDGRTHDTREG